MARDHANIDYFPSYEIISAFPFQGASFEPNMRNVSQAGMQFVMSIFSRRWEKTTV